MKWETSLNDELANNANEPGMTKGGIPKTPLESKIFEPPLEKFWNAPSKIWREARLRTGLNPN